MPCKKCGPGCGTRWRRECSEWHVRDGTLMHDGCNGTSRGDTYRHVLHTGNQGPEKILIYLDQYKSIFLGQIIGKSIFLQFLMQCNNTNSGQINSIILADDIN